MVVPVEAAPNDLDGSEVLVAVCGGIAAYKVCTVVSSLVQRGAGVTVAMTESAMRFVGPLTFQALSGRPVLTSLWEATEHHDSQHIHVTERADLCIVAPATADMIGKIAGGLAHDLVSTLLAAVPGPVLLAPAMNTQMWNNRFVQRNLAALREAGYHLVGPGEGWLACRTVGMGRMAEPEEIVAAAEALLDKRRNDDSKSRKVEQPKSRITASPKSKIQNPKSKI